MDTAKVTKPSIEDIRSLWMGEGELGLEEVADILEGTWRHGTEHSYVVKRLSDNTLWLVGYRTDKDGNYNDLRDGELDDSCVYQVETKTKTVTTYEVVR